MRKRKSPKNLTRYHCCCDLCGTGFNAARPDARFCTPKCRQADYRIRKAADVLAREHVSREDVARLQRLAAIATEEARARQDERKRKRS